MGLFGKSKKQKAADLMASGAKAVGTVVTVRDTGMTVNDNPRVKMTFRLEPIDGSPPFDAEKTSTVSRLEIPRQGDRYACLYDSTEQPVQTWLYLAIADDSGREQLRQMFGSAADSLTGMGVPATPAAGGVDVAGQLTQLAQLRDSGALTNDEFEQQKAKLLGG